MKKGLKSCLIVVLALGGLCIAGVVVMFFTNLCPPQGPWPMPPWCEGSLVSMPIGVPTHEASTPIALATSAPAPSPTGAPIEVAFTVTVPSNTPEHTVVYIEFYDENGENYNTAQMNRKSEFEWALSDVFIYQDLQTRGNLRYRYNRDNFGYAGAEEFEPDSPKSFRTISLNDNLKIKDIVHRWRWMPEPGYVQPIVNARLVPFEPRVDGLPFQKGAEFADWWWNSFSPLLENTDARLKASSVSWVNISPAWDYTQINPTPIISNQVGHAYPDDKLRFHLDKLRQDGLSIYFQPQICCQSINDATFTPEWFDAWYQQYEEFLLYHVDIANEYNIPYFVIWGDWFVIEQKPDNYAERLSNIYSTVKSRYSGKLGRLIYLGGGIENGIPSFYPQLEDIAYMDGWDFMAVNLWVGLTTSPDPTAEELDANVDSIFEARLRPLYTQYGIPVVLNQIAYPSVDGGLIGEVEVFDPAILIWEPYSSKFTLDLTEQAMGYDAVMRAVAQHNYIIGTYPFYYLPGTFPMTLEYNFRDKPAEEVLSQWYESIP